MCDGPPRRGDCAADDGDGATGPAVALYLLLNPLPLTRRQPATTHGEIRRRAQVEAEGIDEHALCVVLASSISMASM